MKFGVARKMDHETDQPTYVFMLGSKGRWFDSKEEAEQALEEYIAISGDIGAGEMVGVRIKESESPWFPSQVIPGEYKTFNLKK